MYIIFYLNVSGGDDSYVINKIWHPAYIYNLYSYLTFDYFLIMSLFAEKILK